MTEYRKEYRTKYRAVGVLGGMGPEATMGLVDRVVGAA